jgi:hypothetical protein
MNQFILAAALLCAAWAGARREQASQAPPDQKERAERRLERLKNADIFLLKLALPFEMDTADYREGVRFKADQKIYFRLIIQNNSPEQVTVYRDDIRSELRPQLRKDGELIPFKMEVDELTKARDESPYVFGFKPSRLLPGRTTEDRIELADWYDELQPGTYQLSVHRRFVFGGRWVESDAISFEVVR